MVSRAALALCMIGCGARPHAPMATASDQVTLYRNRALVQQRVELVVPAGATATGTTITVKLAAGVAPTDVAILERGELTVTELRVAGAVADEPPLAARDAADASDESGEPAPAPAPVAPRPAVPTELTLVVAAPRAGRFSLTLGYVTDRLAWDAAYTMTASAARDHAVLRGAVAIRNTSGIAFRARATLVDGELGAWRERAAERLVGAFTGAPPSPAPPSRDLGYIAIGDGDARVELLANDPPRKLRSVLVYDPIGTRFDHPGAAPISDPRFGLDTTSPTRVTESFEIDRDGRTPGLPAGPVRLLERQHDGSVAVLGESHLFEAATRVADVDSVAIGTADDVIGHRERRDWAKDDDQRRFSEEFLLTIDNARPRPVDVVIREHLYRGQNWTLAYHSVPATKEGAQQIALRTRVPARGHARVLYVVVYTW
jgi:hypothetical protein